jgi:hypothetical protein
MFDLTNKQLITTKYIPSDISDTKSIVFTETPIPGLNYEPVMPGHGGNRKVSFTLPLLYKTPGAGNVAILKQFDALRNRLSVSIFGKKGRGYQFDSNPQVLYFWGTGSIPLVYWVSKCDASHKQGWVNEFGMPQYSEISIELILDESNPIYKAEELFRAVASIAGTVQGIML